MKRKPYFILGGAILAAFLATTAYNRYRDAQPVYVFGADAAPAMKGGPEYAERRAHKLLKLYKEVDGNPGAMGLEALKLPDQGSAEFEGDRDANVGAWTFDDSPPFHNIAFYTDLYAKRNHVYYKDNKMESHPTGFFIVAMKDGDVKRIPVSDIRMMHYQDSDLLVFPGVEGYKSSLPYAPSYEVVKK